MNDLVTVADTPESSQPVAADPVAASRAGLLSGVYTKLEEGRFRCHRCDVDTSYIVLHALVCPAAGRTA